jgi:hypothetical protein
MTREACGVPAPVVFSADRDNLDRPLSRYCGEGARPLACRPCPGSGLQLCDYVVISREPPPTGEQPANQLRAPAWLGRSRAVARSIASP